MVLAISRNSPEIITPLSKLYFYAIAQSRDESTFELQLRTLIESFSFFLTQFKMGEPGVIRKVLPNSKIPIWRKA